MCTGNLSHTLTHLNSVDARLVYSLRREPHWSSENILSIFYKIPVPITARTRGEATPGPQASYVNRCWLSRLPTLNEDPLARQSRAPASPPGRPPRLHEKRATRMPGREAELYQLYPHGPPSGCDSREHGVSADPQSGLSPICRKREMMTT